MCSTTWSDGRLLRSSANLDLGRTRARAVSAAMTHPVHLATAATQEDRIPYVVNLDAVPARRADVVGAKASALARARAAGIPVLPGFVVTTALYEAVLDGPSSWATTPRRCTRSGGPCPSGSAGARRALVVDGRGRRVAVDGGPVPQCSTCAVGSASWTPSTRSADRRRARWRSSCSRSWCRHGAACSSAPIR